MVYKSIWQILGIAPTKDITEIKKAYAAKAKQTNPEEDPEGFEELHNAYRTALRMAKSKVVQPPPSVVVSGPAEKTKEDDKTITFDYSSVSLTGKEDESEEPEEDEEDQFDFSSVSFGDQSLEVIRNYRKLNRISSFAEVESLSRMARISISKEITQIYRDRARNTGDDRLWYLFWNEPIVQYFEADPDFREWVLSSIWNPRHKELVKRITDNLSSLPVEHKWKTKEPRKLRESILSRNITNSRWALLFSTTGIIILGVGVGLFYNLTTPGSRLGPWEVAGVSLLLGLFYLVYTLVDKLFRKRRRK